MKKLLFIPIRSGLLFLFSISFFAKGQTSVYHPFPDSDAVWNEVYTYYEPTACISPHDIYFSYALGGDTLINNLTYHKVYCPYAYSTGDVYCGGGLIYLGPYIGALRQDTSVKKVFFYFDKDSIETLLYNFNAKAGDSIPLNNYYDRNRTFSSYIIGVDSIMIGSDYRTRQWTDMGYIIEGIGYEGGLLEFFPPNVSGFGYRLICFSQDGKTLYPDTSTACNIISSVNILSEKNISISISPNPFLTTATLQIDDLRLMNYDLKIFDVMGRLVRQQIINQESAIINREALPDGLYFYELRTKNYELMGSGKFVVE